MTPDQEREQLKDGIAPSWASTWGEDVYGVFATFEVKGVQQKMRFIPAGRFLMGSSDEDVEAFDDEKPQHLVTLTQGFWLADTPCTNSMWRALMEFLPHGSEGPRRPVVHLSISDIEAFLQRLDRELVDFSAGLPREAQWEYACRAIPLVGDES